MRRKITLRPDSWYLSVLKASPSCAAAAGWDVERDGISRDDEISRDDWERLKNRNWKKFNR